MDPRLRQSGQVWASLLACLAIVLVMVAIITELTPALNAKLAQRECLDRVSAELGLPSSMLLDSQGTTAAGCDTARAVASRAVAAARDAGFSGTVDVWFHEVAEGVGNVDANDRLWAWQVTLSQTSPTRLAGITNTNGIEVVTSKTGHANPYARGRVFRSTGSIGGQSCHYASTQGDDVALVASDVGADALPEQLKGELDRGMSELRDQ